MDSLLERTAVRLQETGGRLTSQRRLIVQVLENIDIHPTAEELHDLVKERDPSVHLSTVYRTLRWLEDEGLVSARVFNDEFHQERFDPVAPSEHYHFLCMRCNKVIEFNTLLVNAIKAQFELHSGAMVESGSVVLYGVCSDCRNLLALPPAKDQVE
ncbi:MAG: Fur family transcriptional regulator [Anaerolineales bacterium]|jgi:Fe2+ or Zn2+ uptake regulation protein